MAKINGVQVGKVWANDTTDRHMSSQGQKCTSNVCACQPAIFYRWL